MKILAIETSCDDASVAIVTDEQKPSHPPFAKGGVPLFDKEGVGEISGLLGPVKILAERTASQVELGKKYGGVFPELAAREHFATLLPTIEETLVTYQPDQDPRETLKNLDAIAVTAGPGLIGSLLVGVTVAQALAMGLGKKLIPVNHLAGHIYSCFLETAENVKCKVQSAKPNPKPKAENPESRSTIYDLRSTTPEFPVLALTVSGGHTQLVWMEGHGKFEVLGRTRDDAAGEAFDKVSVMLGLGYPGGPAIQRAAAEWKSQIPNPKSQRISNDQIPKFPRPMLEEGLEFSFSGLKTAVRYWLDGVHDQLSMTSDELLPADIVGLAAHEVQEAITDVLVTKLLRAAEERNPKSLILAGGVAANRRLREKLIGKLSMMNDQLSMRLHISSRQHSTDNGAMIGAAALAMLSTSIKPVDPAQVEARSSWPLESWR